MIVKVRFACYVCGVEHFAEVPPGVPAEQERSHASMLVRRAGWKLLPGKTLCPVHGLCPEHAKGAQEWRS